jgi:hypothetical protein
MALQKFVKTNWKGILRFVEIRGAFSIRLACHHHEADTANTTLNVKHKGNTGIEHIHARTVIVD